MILLIGYGNPLRSDDGIGRVLAQMLAQRLNQDEVRTYLLHQLTPEVVAAIASASHVIFVDAREGGSAGTVLCEAIRPHIQEGAFTHNTNPAGLLGAARDWYGTAPQGLLISVAGASFDYGEALSPEITALLPTILDEAEQFIRSFVFTPEK